MSSITVTQASSGVVTAETSVQQDTTDRHPRAFLVGSTVLLRVAVSEPGTRIPAAVDQIDLVFLGRVSAQAAQPSVTLDQQVFRFVGTGLYTLAIDTTGFVPGPYLWRVQCRSDTYVTLAEDIFVVRPLGLVEGRLTL